MFRTYFASFSVFALVACTPPTGRFTGDKDPNQPVPKVDPNADKDGDGYSTNQGDCNDNEATIYPMAPELCDGKDHDCNGIVDDICDNDMDGYAVLAGNGKPGGDCNDQDALVNPGAMEVAGDGVDNNCDGQSDEAIATCDSSGNKADPKSFAGAMELCDPWVMTATLNSDSDKSARDIKVHYGKSYKAKQGKNFIVLSTGVAADDTDSNWVSPESGTSFTNDDPNPAPMANNNACYSGADETTVHDYVELKLKLKVPTNAKSFSFQFNFMSAEYPEFVGTEFNDKFLALLDSKAFTGNISFDKNMDPITVNAGFFDVCQTSDVCNGTKTNTCTKSDVELTGTGYEGGTGGGTGWLTTTAPVTPGEIATLRFIIFDEGDHIYDSAVLIDNFQWQVESSSGPVTIQ